MVLASFTSANDPVIKEVVGLIAQATGGSTPTLLNDFGSPASKSRTYLTAGLRVSF